MYSNSKLYLIRILFLFSSVVMVANNRCFFDSCCPNTAKLNKKDEALHQAVEQNNTQQVLNLLETGANPNSQDNYGNTPLHKATDQGNRKIVELLLKHGADASLVNALGKAPMKKAIESGDHDICALLTRHTSYYMR